MNNANRRLLAAATLATVLLAGGARGDLKIVATVTVTHTAPAAPASPTITFHSGGAADAGPPQAAAPPAVLAAAPPQTVTTYYKGSMARTEAAADGPITLYNGAEAKVYTLDPVQKTYFVRSFKDLGQPPSDESGGEARGMKVNADLSVSPGDGTRTFADIPAQVFVLTGTVTVSPEQGSGGRGGGFGGGGGGGRHRRSGGGGYPGGGGFPGGGGGGYPGGGNGGGYPGGGGGDDGGGGFPGGERSRARSRVVEVSGEYWLAEGLKLPDDKKASLLPAFPSADPARAFLFKSLADNLGKKKEIPLHSRITLTNGSSDGDGDAVTTTTEVTSVSADALPDSLFTLPVGYTQIAPPDL